MRVICQICGESIAEISIEGVEKAEGRPAIPPIRYPVTGAMFGSPDPFHGAEAPFAPDLDWEFLRCPHGRIHRPMAVDDLVLTHKGLVRLPKDGSPAFMDPEAKAEIGRESIGDRVIVMSDEEAERQAREILQGGPRVVVSDEVPDGKVLIMDAPLIVESKEPIPPLHFQKIKYDPNVSGWICATCSKRFDTEKQLKGHLLGAHKAKPVPVKAPVKKAVVAIKAKPVAKKGKK